MATTGAPDPDPAAVDPGAGLEADPLLSSLLRTGPGKTYILDPDDDLAPPRGAIGATELVDQLVHRLNQDPPHQAT